MSYVRVNGQDYTEEELGIPVVTDMGDGFFFCSNCGSCPGNIHYYDCPGAPEED